MRKEKKVSHIYIYILTLNVSVLSNVHHWLTNITDTRNYISGHRLYLLRNKKKKDFGITNDPIAHSFFKYATGDKTKDYKRPVQKSFKHL